MSETPITSSIPDEDTFRDIIATERSKRVYTHDSSLFDALAASIHAALARQDSESALALITR